MNAEIGIIGGTGIYDPGIFDNISYEKVHTAYGQPSSKIAIGELEGIKVAFIPRHGEGHIFPPHKVPYRANIYALKSLNVKSIIAPMAVGSLKDEFRPGDIAFPTQFIDNTRKRSYTFYDGGQVAHISMAEPFCARIRDALISSAQSLNLNHHDSATYVCIEGPRFSTKAESHMYRSWGADLIGMTLVPEAQLAREAEVCYQPICTITDYDVWKEDKTVTSDEVIEVMKNNSEKVKKVLARSIPDIQCSDCICRHSLDAALL